MGNSDGGAYDGMFYVLPLEDKDPSREDDIQEYTKCNIDGVASKSSPILTTAYVIKDFEGNTQPFLKRLRIQVFINVINGYYFKRRGNYKKC